MCACVRVPSHYEEEPLQHPKGKAGGTSAGPCQAPASSAALQRTAAALETPLGLQHGHMYNTWEKGHQREVT